MPIRVDSSSFPRVVVTWEGAASDADLIAHQAELGRLLERNDSRVVIYDVRAAQIPTPKQRQLQTDWLKKYDDRIRETTVGMAFVIESALMRGALTAVFWVQPLPSPSLVAKTLEEAFAWARDRLDATAARSLNGKSR